MSPDQVSLAMALDRATFPPGSFDKRFVRDMTARAKATVAGSTIDLTEKQASHLQRMAWKYRRQIPAFLVPAVKPT